MVSDTINVNELISEFEQMAERGSLLIGPNVHQDDLLFQIIGTIVHVAHKKGTEEKESANAEKSPTEKTNEIQVNHLTKTYREYFKQLTDFMGEVKDTMYLVLSGEDIRILTVIYHHAEIAKSLLTQDFNKYIQNINFLNKCSNIEFPSNDTFRKIDCVFSDYQQFLDNKKICK